MVGYPQTASTARDYAMADAWESVFWCPFGVEDAVRHKLVPAIRGKVKAVHADGDISVLVVDGRAYRCGWDAWELV